MAKRTIDFGDYKEPTWEEYSGEPPLKNTWYTGQVKRVMYKEDDDQLVFIVEITEGEFKGWGKGWYAPFEGSLKWKLQEMIRALQGGKTTPVSIDWENEVAVANWLKKAKTIKFKTELYNDDIKIRKVGPLLTAVGNTTAPAPGEAELPGDTDAGDEPLEDYTEDELKAKNVDELLDILADEFEVPEEELPEEGTGRGAAIKHKKAIIAMILEVQAEGEDGEEEPEGEDTDEPADDDTDEGFEDGFEDDPDADPEEEPEPEPEPAKPAARRARKAAPAAAPAPAPAKAAAAPAGRRRRG